MKQARRSNPSLKATSKLFQMEVSKDGSFDCEANN